MRLLLTVIFTGFLMMASAQQTKGVVRIDGQYLPYEVSECGDTILLATLQDVTVSTPRFDNAADRARYRKYKRYALKVYPYAVEAIKIFREVEYATAHYHKRHRKRYVKNLHQQLKEEFTDPLKNLSKTQGKIMIKMIENELDTPIYFLIKDLRGGWTARYWSTMGIFFGHHLEQGYVEGEDEILDAVLHDLPVSYQVPESFISHFDGEERPFRVKKKWKRYKKRQLEDEDEEDSDLP